MRFFQQLRPDGARGMNTDRTRAVLYETEATLRLVDRGLDGLRDESLEPDVSLPAGEMDTQALPHVLARANVRILDLLTRLRETRAAINTTTLKKLVSTHEKIREVSCAAESAATNIMDACDRATQLVDDLDALDAEPTRDRIRATSLRATLRDELFVMVGALQFQDITAQQLAHASAMLVEMEERIVEIASLFDAKMQLAAAELEPEVAVNCPHVYDPNATTLDCESRQALADEIFTSVRAPAA